MKISIVTICLNDLQGLKKTRDSILCQTWKDWEWIVIDGGSSDGTKEFLQDHQEEMSYWCSEKDKGVYDAQNKGAQKATGNYCIFMNANDKFHDEHVLEIMVNSHPTADVVYGNWIQVFEDQQQIKVQAPKEVSLSFILYNNICHQAMFINTALIKESPYNNSYKIYGDWAKWLDFIIKGRTFQYIDCDVCEFAMNGVSQNNIQQCHTEYDRFILENLGTTGAELVRIIKKQKNEIENLKEIISQPFFKRLHVSRFIPKFLQHAIDKYQLHRLIYQSKLFDKKWYVSTYPQVKEYKKSPLSHYLKVGYKLGYDPSILFSTRTYQKNYPHVYESNINPLVHYLQEGKKQKYRYWPHISEEEEKNNWMKITRPLVSVIVPNYNHAPFLRQRLDSIYNQTYSNIEVLLMDDVSSDGSVQILNEYAQEHPSISRCIVNKSNSGSPFSQWQKGISMAHGQFIWIAESDDWCDNDFLEKLLPSFMNEAVMLSFGRSVFMKNDKQIWSIEEYLHDLDKSFFTHPFEMASNECVKKFFSKKNIIPNVSSCVFRKPMDSAAFDIKGWNEMKVCGDWLFYLQLINGGYIAYNPKAKNYYRQHNSNTSVNLHQRDIYYHEHQKVREFLASHFNLNKKELDWIKEDKRNFWKQNRKDYDQNKFEQIFDDETINLKRKERLPKIAICTYAFSTGGGEKVPIDMANALKQMGYGVTFIDAGGEPRNEKIRNKLRSDIPLISLGWCFFQLPILLKQLGVEVIHTHHTSVDYCTSEQLSSKDIKQVVTLHGMYETVKPKYLATQIPYMAKRVKKWFYIADKNTPIMLKYGVKKENLFKIFNAVPNIPPSKTREEVLQECGFEANCFLIAISSRALPTKGWKLAYDSIKHVRRETQRDICIVFLGNGECYDQMKPSSEKWAHFTGYSNDVSSYFNASDLVMLPSTYPGESFPLCLLEAFAAHKPVIASNIGEISNMMTNSNGTAGILLEIQSDGQISQTDIDNAIDLMSQKGEPYLRAKSIAEEQAQRFNINKLVEILTDQYRKIINQ